MNRSLLLIISSNPRTSHRPAEAIRIAAGLHASRQINLALYLHEAALLILNPEIAGLLDEDNYRRYLPLLSEPPPPVYTLSQNSFAGQIGPPTLPYRLLEPISLGRWAASYNSILRY